MLRIETLLSSSLPAQKILRKTPLLVFWIDDWGENRRLLTSGGASEALARFLASEFPSETVESAFLKDSGGAQDYPTLIVETEGYRFHVVDASKAPAVATRL